MRLIASASRNNDSPHDHKRVYARLRRAMANCWAIPISLLRASGLQAAQINPGTRPARCRGGPRALAQMQSRWRLLISRHQPANRANRPCPSCRAFGLNSQSAKAGSSAATRCAECRFPQPPGRHLIDDEATPSNGRTRIGDADGEASMIRPSSCGRPNRRRVTCSAETTGRERTRSCRRIR